MATGKRRTNSAVRVLVARVERVIAPVAALEHVRVVAEPELDRVEELAQVIVRVVARELGTVRLEGVPAPDPAVVRLKTKLVIAAHPHGLLRLLAEAEVSAAVAEISLAPAATEAATAWVAVDLVEVVEEAAAVAAEEDVVDEQIR